MELHKKYHLNQPERKQPAHIIVTRGSKPIVVSKIIGDKVDQMLYEVPKLDKALIKDTNGAGDSFVGGFLS